MNVLQQRLRRQTDFINVIHKLHCFLFERHRSDSCDVTQQTSLFILASGFTPPWRLFERSEAPPPTWPRLWPHRQTPGGVFRCFFLRFVRAETERQDHQILDQGEPVSLPAVCLPAAVEDVPGASPLQSLQLIGRQLRAAVGQRAEGSIRQDDQQHPCRRTHTQHTTVCRTAAETHTHFINDQSWPKRPITSKRLCPDDINQS